MYTCYSGEPKKWAKAVVIGLAVLAVLLFLASYVIQTYKGIFQLAAAISVCASLLLSFKLLTSYIYEISENDTPGAYDLVITEVRGKKNRVVCRVSVPAGSLITLADNEKLPDVYGPKCDFTVWGVDKSTVMYFLPSEEEGGGIVRFAPDAEMVTIMERLGVSRVFRK